MLSFMYVLILRTVNWTALEIKAWTGNYKPWFDVKVITYKYPKLDAGLANLC